MSSGAPVCWMAPWPNCTEAPVILTPLPRRWPLAPVPPSTSSKFARDPLYPMVEALAMLSPTTLMASPCAPRPLDPVNRDVQIDIALASDPNDVGRVDGDRADLVDRLAVGELEGRHLALDDRRGGNFTRGAARLDLHLVAAGGEELARRVLAVPHHRHVAGGLGAEGDATHLLAAPVGDHRLHLGGRAAEVRRQ